MIVLDTKFLSESMRPSPNAQVVRWLGEQLPATVFTTRITQAEILHASRSCRPESGRTEESSQ